MQEQATSSSLRCAFVALGVLRAPICIAVLCAVVLVLPGQTHELYRHLLLEPWANALPIVFALLTLGSSSLLRTTLSLNTSSPQRGAIEKNAPWRTAMPFTLWSPSWQRRHSGLWLTGWRARGYQRRASQTQRRARFISAACLLRWPSRAAFACCWYSHGCAALKAPGKP